MKRRDGRKRKAKKKRREEGKGKKKGNYRGKITKMAEEGKRKEKRRRKRGGRKGKGRSGRSQRGGAHGGARRWGSGVTPSPGGGGINKQHRAETPPIPRDAPTATRSDRTPFVIPTDGCGGVGGGARSASGTAMRERVSGTEPPAVCSAPSAPHSPRNRWVH